jgi:hypothetical protein
MSDFLTKKISENRSGSSSSNTSQGSSSFKLESGQSRTTTSRANEKAITDTTQNETRSQDRNQTEDTTRNEKGHQTSTNSQTQARSQTQNTTQTRNLTAHSSGQETIVEMADIGAAVTFTIKIRGGLGTVPEGSTPPAPVCQK